LIRPRLTLICFFDGCNGTAVTVLGAGGANSRRADDERPRAACGDLSTLGNPELNNGRGDSGLATQILRLVSIDFVRSAVERLGVFVPWLFAVAILVCLPMPRGAAGRANPYPNELPGFKLYEKYIAPLRPGVSVHQDAVAKFGTDQRVEVGGWVIATSWRVNWAIPLATPPVDRLGDVTLVPKAFIPMSRVKFSKAFEHAHGDSADVDIGCPCDVYQDLHYLSYWVGRQRQLVQIVYGSAR
jgi:hypothetical protein